MEAILALDSTLIVDSPAQVDLEHRSTIPVFILRSSSMYHLWLFSDVRCGAIVATNPKSGEIAIDVTEPSEGLPAEIDWSYTPQLGGAVSFETFDLRERLVLPWRPGRWVVRAIIHDLVSPPAYTELVGDEWRTESIALQAPTPVSEWLTYPAPTEAASSEPGVTVQAPTIVNPPNDPAARISVQFTVPFEPGRHVPPAQGDLFGVLPVHVFFTGFLEPRGPLVTVNVPIQHPPVTAAGGQLLISGAFDLHLAALAGQGLDLREQEYQVYAFAGEHMAGPTKIQLGAKSLLPPLPEPEIPQIP